MELVPYTDADYWLTEALETDPVVMGELGGPWPREDIPGIHRRRMDAIRNGTWWFTMVPDPEMPPVGHLGIFHSDWQGQRISEAGWAVLPAYQGRGYASAALELLLDRAAADGRWGTIHAMPGVTNGPSNALCRKFGFRLVGEETVDYRGRPLRCNHWVREEIDASTSTKRG
jgi:RimJ/RimL family protein N-acetyltransferase